MRFKYEWRICTVLAEDDQRSPGESLFDGLRPFESFSRVPLESSFLGRGLPLPLTRLNENIDVTARRGLEIARTSKTRAESFGPLNRNELTRRCDVTEYRAVKSIFVRLLTTPLFDSRELARCPELSSILPLNRTQRTFAGKVGNARANDHRNRWNFRGFESTLLSPVVKSTIRQFRFPRWKRSERDGREFRRKRFQA